MKINENENCGGKKMGRFFQKMYVISKCLNTHGRIGSKLES